MNVDALLIVAGMIAVTGFSSLAGLLWWAQRKDAAFRREMEQRHR